MAIDWQNQVRTVTDIETDALASLGVRHVRHWQDTLNSHIGAAMAQKVISFASPDFQSVSDYAGQERVALCFAPIEIASHFDVLSIDACHRLSVDGGGDVTWVLYCHTEPYKGPAAFDASYLGTTYSSSTVASSTSTTFDIDSLVRGLSIVRHPTTGLTWFTLTSEGSAAGDSSHIVTLDATAEMSAVYA